MSKNEQGKIKIRGVEHYYEWIRKKEDKKTEKPVMIFIHGWGGSCKYWRNTAWSIVDEFDCLLYDLRGFGQSLLPPKNEHNLSYELEEYAEDLIILLEAFNLDKIYLNAHSMGGSVATLFLNKAPKKIEKAILTCNGIFTYDKTTFDLFHKFGSYVVKFRYNWFLKVPYSDLLFMARFLNRPISRDLSKIFLEDFLLADYEAALGTIYTSVSKKAVEIMPQEFANIQVPTLLIAGEKDQIIPASMGKEAAILNDKINYVEIANTGHFPMLEDAPTYLSNIKDFLNN
jgi:pimeloyl-ACP methyl ester carboxylesterase